MKKIVSPMILSAFVCSLVFTMSCSKKDEPEPIPLTAKAGDDKTAEVLTTVTLDGAGSTGSGTFQYTWELVNVGGANDVNQGMINLANASTAIATFIPPKNGFYRFKLTITQGNQFSSDEILITVATVRTLSGTLSDNVSLVDIESDPSKPDYQVTADLVIPSGKTLSINNANVVIEAADNVGIEIGGTLVSTVSVKFISSTGWKGLLVNGGSLNLSTGCSIEKGGKSAFSGQTEAAAITVASGSITMTGAIFFSSGGYDLRIISTSTSSSVASTSFTAAKPVKTPIDYLRIFNSNGYTGGYDYITITTPGAGTIISNGSIGYVFQNAKYYLDGDLTVGSRITSTNSTIYMKEGAGILASVGMDVVNTTFDGLSGASWKGIALNGNSSSSLNNTIVKNAGSAVFNTGAFTSSAKAAIYCATSQTIINSEISQSGGYGIYIDPTSGSTNVNNTKISSTTLAGITAPVNLLNLIGVTSPNTYTMNAGVPAVEIQSVIGGATPVGTWPSLGGNNFYQFLSGVTLSSGSWTLAPGVNVKFKSGKTLYIQQGLFKAIGTAVSPITFDSDAGTSGSWPGILLESTYNLEYCNIKNGGQSEVFKGGITPATEKANVVFNYGGGVLTNTFKNNTISGGAGYGTLIESGKQDPQPLLAGNANTFTSNALGTSIKKP